MVGAQGQQFNGMDQRYNIYRQDYGTDNNYNSYEPEYGTDNKYNSYEPEYGTDYGMNSYDKKPYGKDNKDNSYDKSKDSSSVNVKKIVCNNFNINGLDFGALPPALNGLTSESQAADEGANGASSFGSGSGGDGRT